MESAAELEAVERLFPSGEGRTPRLQALIETACGVVEVERIAAAATRLDALTVGHADLAVSLRRPALEGASWRWAGIQDRVLVAARANGRSAIDGPCLRIDPRDELDHQLAAAHALGFDGKWAIHPAQVGPIAAAFTPSAAELEGARETLEALGAAELRGDGAAATAGGMADEASRQAALAIVRRAGER